MRPPSGGRTAGGRTAGGRPRGSRWLGLILGIGLLLASCSPTSSVEPTPLPTAAPRPTAADAAGVLRAYLTAWRLHAYGRMYELLSAADRERYPEAAFVQLYETFDSLVEVTDLSWVLGNVTPTSLPPAPRAPDLPPPSATAAPAPSGGPQSAVSPTPQPTAVATPVPPDTVVAGPVPGMRASADIAYHTNRFDVIHLQRELLLVRGADGWALRWSPDQLLPGLDINSGLSVKRIAPDRGSIVGQDGTVWAETSDDGVRVYPQEWNAGQTIGYVTPATDDEVKQLEPKGYVAGDVIGRLGLEKGADALLRGRPGYRLLATNQAGASSVLLERPVVEGANLTITLRADVQRTADAQIGGYGAGAGTAVVDPKSGDVWALASAPLFNPNSMVLGTTLSGQRLSASTSAQRFNQAVLGAYPAGSSFKPFTLMAALRTGVAGPATRMPCNGTWTFDGFTFHNYEDHTLGGSVNLLQAMAFSCNTTYMPLSIRVYDANQTALTDLVGEFGFGQFTGISHLEEESGILPDASYFQTHKRWNGVISPYGPFDQIQLAIGQGSYQGTPLQLATAYAAIGNGGTLWVPRLVVDATLPSGKLVEHNDPAVHNQIELTPDQWAYVVEALKAVVNYSYGTAYSAFRGYGIQVAGKSGTAETGTPNPHAWFPAFAPADNPQIAVATVLLYIHLGTGGTDAAPLDRRIMTTYFANP